MRTFSTLYGAGFGLGMCAPTFSQLQRDFFADSGPVASELILSPLQEAEFKREMSLIEQETQLRNKFRQ